LYALFKDPAEALVDVAGFFHGGFPLTRRFAWNFFLVFSPLFLRNFLFLALSLFPSPFFQPRLSQPAVFNCKVGFPKGGTGASLSNLLLGGYQVVAPTFLHIAARVDVLFCMLELSSCF